MMTQLQNYVIQQAQSDLEQYLRGEGSKTLTPNQSAQNLSPTREPIKHLLIGSPKAVTSTIHYLQAIGYANVGVWSPLLPTGNPGEVMSILIRQILMQ
ncbi:MAG: hypothetical protein KME31_21205 [Tolypothrix carrinoi HA7290-LM1]|jgi:7-keto-8-aminopelargonate synthetase-like enzyme|nr:hypothetical protein [Tolypothrix carrinoi HA7290-LM1]